MGTYITEGVILKHKDYREADRIITIFTKEVGKLKAVARGSRKITSKLAGNLEPFTVSKLAFVRGRTFDTVTASDVTVNYRSLKERLSDVWIAGYISEVIDSSLVDNQRDVRVYKLLREVFDYIDAGSMTVSTRSAVVWYFVWRQLAFVGYQPELYSCLKCGLRITAQDNFFSFRRGGLICSRCKQGSAEGQPVSRNAIKIIRIALEHTLEEISNIKVDTKIRTELNGLTGAFLSYTQERDLAITRVLPKGR